MKGDDMKGKRLFGRAFTLIELLVVMGIIGLLVMLLMPVVTYAIAVAQGVSTSNTIGRIEAGLAAFHADFGVYPPSDEKHEPMINAQPFGYKNLAYALRGPQGTGWGSGETSNLMPFGGTSTEKFGPYFEGDLAASGIADAFNPAAPILYFRYERSGDPEATDPNNAVYDFNDNNDNKEATNLAKGEDGFTSQGNLMMLLRRKGTYQYVRRDYVLISAGPDRVFGYRKGPDANGAYTFVPSSMRPTSSDYLGAYCDDVTNFKYERY